MNSKVGIDELVKFGSKLRHRPLQAKPLIVFIVLEYAWAVYSAWHMQLPWSLVAGLAGWSLATFCVYVFYKLNVADLPDWIAADWNKPVDTNKILADLIADGTLTVEWKPTIPAVKLLTAGEKKEDQ